MGFYLFCNKVVYFHTRLSLTKLILVNSIMRMPATESVLVYLIPSCADVLTGFGLSALLEFSRTSPSMPHFVLLCLSAVLLAALLSMASPSKPPAWVALCNSTFSLILTLSLALNLLSQLCPPTGKEFSLIPAYVLLCVPRASPTGLALVWQAGATLALLSVFLLSPSDDGARPRHEEGLGLPLFFSVASGTFVQTLRWPSSALDALYDRSRLWDALRVLVKGLLLLVLGVAGRARVYYFMFERSHDAVPFLVLVAYCVLLLFACMQSASAWMGLMREILGERVKWRLMVRIQHIINAFLVAVAWIYPLQLHGLRMIALLMLTALNLVGR